MAKRRYATHYDEINDALLGYENHKSWNEHSLDWVSNRIDWCWKFRKINREQFDELTDRIIKVFEEA